MMEKCREAEWENKSKEEIQKRNTGKDMRHRLQQFLFY